MKLTPTEQKVLSYIHLDAETPLAEVARATSLKVHTVRRAIDSMIERELIWPSLIINSALLCENSYILVTYFSLLGLQKSVRKQLIDELKRNPHITWLLELVGEFEFVAQIDGSDSEGIEQVFSSLTDRFGLCVSRRATALVLDYTMFGRRHLLTSPHQNKPLVVARGAEIVKVDAVDCTLMRIRLKGPLRNTTEISKEMGLPLSTVIYRLKRLKDLGVLRRTVYYLNYSKDLVTAFQLLIDCGGPRSEHARLLMNWANKNSAVVSCHTVLGGWDLEFCIELDAQQEISPFLTAFCDQFGKIIQSYKVLVRQREIKWESASAALLERISDRKLR